MLTQQPCRLTPDHLAEAAAIYNHAVWHTDATMDTEERGPRQAWDWLTEHDGDRYPAFGVVHNGVLSGYGTLSPFARRAGYRASAEISIYIAPECQGRGIGTRLCSHLTAHAERVGLSTVLALVTSTNRASLRMFGRAGYERTGVMRNVGYKLGRLVDICILQRDFPRNFALYSGGASLPLASPEGGVDDE